MDQTFEKRKKVIYDFICDDFYIPMKVKEIATVLQVSKEQRRELQEVLDALVEEGKITTIRTIFTKQQHGRDRDKNS